MNGQILYNRQAISPILFKADVMGSSTAIRVAKFQGTIDLPQLENSSAQQEFSSVIPPQDYSAGVLDLLERDEKEKVAWGRQVALPGGEAIASDYLLQFKVAKTKRAAMEDMEKIEVGLESWFALVRSWVEVLTHQDLSIDEPLGGAVDKGNYYWSWQSKKKWRMATAATFHVTVTMPDTSHAITLKDWQLAIGRANKGVTPPNEHLIFRDARARFVRGQYKYAAIFLGVAAELTLKKKLEAKITQQRKSNRVIEAITGNALGKILDICEAMSIALPNDARTINTVRNKAIHRHAAVSREEVEKSLKATEELLKLHSKL